MGCAREDCATSTPFASGVAPNGHVHGFFFLHFLLCIERTSEFEPIKGNNIDMSKIKRTGRQLPNVRSVLDIMECQFSVYFTYGRAVRVVSLVRKMQLKRKDGACSTIGTVI